MEAKKHSIGRLAENQLIEKTDKPLEEEQILANLRILQKHMQRAKWSKAEHLKKRKR